MTTKHSLAPWSVDTVHNEGEHGSGPDTSTGFDSYAVYDANGRHLFDSINSDAAEILTGEDEDGGHAWDEVARKNLHIAAAAPELLETLQALIGDAKDAAAFNKQQGFHDIAAERLRRVRAAEAVIAKATGAAT